ncbi:hypothetical protein LA080_007591 [Diaporthe eres]|uniref:Uncharacterized protein n=1 Tax=Diaporthe vaccinii TaxID=105482 RepID=A0ABR4FFA3_9PEZI|nr:hypothetical protein LA080_007591 [Diaporthe eres]
MAITSEQQEPGTSNHVSEAAKPHYLVREEIKSFHESLESERIHRVLIRWRKRKRDEELSNGTAILEKILRTLREELESHKERAELWDRALVTELQPDRARQELDGRAAASALSLEKQTQFVHAIASVLSIEVSGEEVGKMLSKTTASTAPAAEPPRSMPPTPPADRHSPVTPHDTRTLHIDTHIRDPDPKRLSVTPRIPASKPTSQGGSGDKYKGHSQGLKPQGQGDKTRSPTRAETADHYASTSPTKKSRTDGPSALKPSAPEKKPTRPARNVRVSD